MGEFLEALKAVDLATSIFLAVLGGLISLVFWLVRKRGGITHEIREEVGRVADPIADLERRVSAVETKMEGVATKGDLVEIRRELSSIGNAVTRLDGHIEARTVQDAALSERLGQLTTQLNMIYEAKMREGKTI